MISNVVIVPNEIKDPGLICAAATVKKVLELGKNVYIPKAFAEYFDKNAVGLFPKYSFPDNADIAIVIGGDGSVIHTAREAALKGVPIIGINLGRLGYLAELEADETDLLEKVLSGEYFIEERMMLSFEIVKKDGSIIKAPPALNDIVFTNHGNTNRVVELKVYAENYGTLAGAYRGDGVIVSTPTGSTAYALAAGGPVVDPALDCFNIVPICTHTLMARPMLFSAANTIRLVNSGRITVNVSADGSDEYTIEPDEYVSVKRSEHTAKFARIKNNSFYEILRNKMRTDS